MRSGLLVIPAEMGKTNRCSHRLKLWGCNKGSLFSLSSLSSIYFIEFIRRCRSFMRKNECCRDIPEDHFAFEVNRVHYQQIIIKDVTMAYFNATRKVAAARGRELTSLDEAPAHRRTLLSSCWLGTLLKGTSAVLCVLVSLLLPTHLQTFVRQLLSPLQSNPVKVT